MFDRARDIDWPDGPFAGRLVVHGFLSGEDGSYTNLEVHSPAFWSPEVDLNAHIDEVIDEASERIAGMCEDEQKYPAHLWGLWLTQVNQKVAEETSSVLVTLWDSGPIKSGIDAAMALRGRERISGVEKSGDGMIVDFEEGGGLFIEDVSSMVEILEEEYGDASEMYAEVDEDN